MATQDKPKRTKSILEYLQDDIPKVGGEEDAVEGEGEQEGAAPPDINAVAERRKKKPARVV